MTTVHAKNGALYLGTGVAVPIAEAVEWMVSIESDRADDSALGDPWETRLKGANRWVGSALANFDTASTALYDIATATATCRAYLYPDRAVPTNFYYGLCWPDLKIDASRKDAGRLTLAWQGNGALAQFVPYSQVVLADSPLLYWQLNETDLDETDRTAIDYGSELRNLTTRGPDLVLSSGPAGIPIAWTFPGATLSYLNGANAPILANQAAGSVEFWGRLTAETTNSVPVSASLGGYAPWHFQRIAASDTLLWEVRDSASGTYYDATWTYPVDSSWHHIVGVVSGGRILLYVDGALVDDQPGPATFADDGYPKHIGWFDGLGRPWYGDLTQVAVYGTALSADRIAAHYNAGIGA